ncbi:MAG: SurA N-terminal domain-containing protein [Nanoarchaeota archaeon]|nr:SurA N-terminal domain-containing protein [Nanoarchaeota archaeon]
MSDFNYNEDEEDMEGNVYIDEKEAVLEEDLFLDKDLKIKKKDDDDDFYKESDEEEEKQKTLLDTKKPEEKKSIEEKPKVIPPVVVQNSKKSREIKKESVEVKVEDKKVKEKAKTPKKPVGKKKPAKVENKTSNKKEVKAKVSKKKSTKKNYFWPIFISLAIIALIVFAVIYFQTPANVNNKVVAKVNGQEITMEELNKEYEFFFFMGGLPEEYKSEITKEIFLTSSMVSEVIILQEAERNNIVVSDEEVNAFLTESISVPGASMEQFEEAANSRGLSLEDIHKYLKRQLISFEVLNKTVLGEIEVTDEDIFAAYNENIALFENQGQSFADVKDYIEQTILTQKQRDAAQLYMDDLRSNGSVEIYYSEEQALQETVTETTEEELVEEVVGIDLIKTFEETGDEMCYDEDGKPLVILFSTTYCPHCVWIKDTFDSVVAEYDVAAYHWELDKGDNFLTAEMESTLPKQHIDILKEYNPQGYVPTFVVGCKYVRIGNGYEAEDSLVMEENELRAIIESLI